MRCAAGMGASQKIRWTRSRGSCDELGLRNARVGMEVPSWYLHPHHYLRIKAMLGDALVAEPSTLVLDLKLVKSPREQAYIRELCAHCGRGAGCAAGPRRGGPHGAGAGGGGIRDAAVAGSGLPASTMNLVTGERCSTVLGAPTERRLQRGDPGMWRSRRRFAATPRRSAGSGAWASRRR